VSAPATARVHPPFWSDDFDVDLLKVIPGIDETLGKAADIQLWTHGHTTFGRLNSPACWNTHKGLAAFFGFRDAATPDGYSYGSDELIACTWLELVRDCWVHTYRVYVEQLFVLDGEAFWRDFAPIMYHVRAWRVLDDATLARHVDAARERIAAATVRLEAIRRARGES
jgi:hypothetical protein